MNSNQHNDYEIINPQAVPYLSDKNNNYSKYPYTNNSNLPMENKHYKEWLNMCQEDLQYNSDISQYATTAALYAISGIIDYFSPYPVAKALPLLRFITPYFWPPKESQNVWINFINSTEALIGKTIRPDVKDNAVRYLTDVQTAIENYNDALDSWLPNPKNSSFQLNLSTAWNNAESKLETAINFAKGVSGSSTEKEETILLLPIYAHLANLHLLLLRDISIYGPTDFATWKVNENDIKRLYTKQIRLTNEYITHCTTNYNTGLEMVKKNPLKLFSWNYYNSFRRNITIQVLDIIALFSFYDTHKYPANINNYTITQIVKAELPRVVYTDAHTGDVLSAVNGIDQLEQALTRPSHLFSTLRLLRLFAGRNNLGSISLTANSVCAEKATENGCSFGEPYGQKTDSNTETTLQFGGVAIDKITLFSPTSPKSTPELINKLMFYQGERNVSTFNPGGEISNIPTKTFQIPSVTINNKTFTHNLYYMKTTVDPSLALDPYTFPRRQVAFAWTYSSVDSNNTIQEKVITAIPIIKSQSVNNTTIIPNPGH
ncbi:insecticidal delta-endotoxin Cry8Ea1 family protein, partial [Bacillus mycoides]|uniref:insecticidal delta-endotoxin Cry8Ea1 family protein n=1 Tax=Bacillus mycoides TaxID=1405 RepID=UPI003D049529